MAPGLDLDMAQKLGRELHSHGGGPNSVMTEGEVCPWTLFLTLTLTLLKGSLPYLPKVLPAVISDEATRERAVRILESDDFQNNIEKYFVENVKSEIQAPMNRQIMQSTEAIKYMVDLIKGFSSVFFPASSASFEDPNVIYDQPKSYEPSTLEQVINFAQTLYQLSKRK